jgi:hypothetical protein
MDEIIKGTLLGIGSTTLGDVRSNPSGREIWIGVRIRTEGGKSRFLKGMLVESEAALIITEAMDRGEPVELWLTGKDERAYPYGVRTAREAWYHDGYSGYLRGQGLKFLILGILTIPLLGAGVLIMIGSIGWFIASAQFAARRSRAAFERGYEAAVSSSASDAGSRLRAA